MLNDTIDDVGFGTVAINSGIIYSIITIGLYPTVGDNRAGVVGAGDAVVGGVLDDEAVEDGGVVDVVGGYDHFAVITV